MFILSNRAIVAVSGADAHEFLQGLITNDIHKVSESHAVFTALLSPQGKFLYDFFVLEHDGKLLLDADKKQLPDLIKRLTMYKLRSKVEIAEMPELKVGAGWGSELQAKIKYQDPRLPELGMRLIGSDLAIEDNDEYEKRRLSLGVPAGGIDLESGNAFPMQWGYDRLNAINFNKGCYVGQEVTARSKHIGTIRKMVHQVHSDAALPAIGTPIIAEEKEVGKMASSKGTIGLALLNTDAANSGVTLYSNGTKIQANIPAWVQANP